MVVKEVTTYLSVCHMFIFSVMSNLGWGVNIKVNTIMTALSNYIHRK